MRLIVAVAINLASLIGPAICQTSTPPVPSSIAGQIRIDSLQLQRRADGYGIAGFVISNNSDQALKSVELTCWVNGDRAHGTKVLVWPNLQSILAHDQQQFSNVNIGSVGEGSRAECEVTEAD